MSELITYKRLLNIEKIKEYLADFVKRPKSNRVYNDAILLVEKSINSKLEVTGARAGSYIARFQLKKEKVAEDLYLTIKQVQNALQFLRKHGILIAVKPIPNEFGFLKLWSIDFRTLPEEIIDYVKITIRGFVKNIEAADPDSKQFKWASSTITFSGPRQVEWTEDDYQLFDLKTLLEKVSNTDYEFEKLIIDAFNARYEEINL